MYIGKYMVSTPIKLSREDIIALIESLSRMLEVATLCSSSNPNIG